MGFRIVMIIFGIVGCAIFFFTFASVRERVTTVFTQATLVESLKSLAKNRPWIIFALNVLVMWGGFFIQTSAIVYYYKAVIGSVSLSVTVATIMSVVPMAANFFVPAFAKRLGKRNLYVSAAAVQSANAVTAIRAMYLYIPMILLVCSIVIMMFYNLDKIYPQIKRELEQRQQNKE